MLSDATRDAIQRWVAAKFDLTADQIIETPWYFKSHGPTLADYHGVYIWRLGRTLIVSAPPDAIDAMLGALGGNQPVGMIYAPDSHDPFDAVGEAGFWLVLLGDQVERIVGPSYQGFVDTATFQPADEQGQEQGARPLTAADQPALQRFIAACPTDAWQDSAIAPDHEPIIGLERDGELIALASAPPDGSADAGVRSVGVVTLPAWRGRGAGLAVVSALTAHCLARGAILHYQTLRANLPAVAIARRLGYEDVATALAIRLR